jgi:hypothetical protein
MEQKCIADAERDNDVIILYIDTINFNLSRYKYYIPAAAATTATFSS